MSEISALKAQGLDPAPADIVRLNAIGLKLDHNFDACALYRLRRTVTVADVTLQEPTIAHDLFASRLHSLGFDDSDSVTFVLLRAWLLSFDADELPRHMTPDGVTAVIDRFCRDHFAGVTYARLERAVAYVLYGAQSAALEKPAVPASADKTLPTADDAAEAAAFSLSVGVIHEAEKLGLGISLDDALRHTLGEMNAIVEQAVRHQYATADVLHGTKIVDDARRQKATEEFYATLEEIKSRLERERDAAAKKED